MMSEDKEWALDGAKVQEAPSDGGLSRSGSDNVGDQRQEESTADIATTPPTDHVFRTVDKGT